MLIIYISYVDFIEKTRGQKIKRNKMNTSLSFLSEITNLKDERKKMRVEFTK